MVVAVAVLAVAILAEVVLAVVVLAEVVLVVLAEVVLFDVDDDSVHVVVVPCLSCSYFYYVPCLALVLCS